MFLVRSVITLDLVALGRRLNLERRNSFGFSEEQALKERTLDALIEMKRTDGMSKEAAAVVMHDILGYPHQQVASVLGTSEEASRAMINTGRRYLRDTLL